MFVIEVPYINLDQIYQSGQCFRWIRLKEGKYVIPFGGQALKIDQQKERLILNCTDQQFYDLWFKYFDMQTDYLAINDKAKRENEFMKICANRANGVRVLQQDTFEMIITFALATATTIPRIKSMLDLLCKVCGIEHTQSMREAGRVTWYEFPTPESILANQDKLDDCKLGYRKNVIVQLCQDIVDGWLSIDDLKAMSYKEAKNYLMSFNGIGPKVADCICLYGLHHLEAFPTDTHIQQILKREFECDDYETFADWYLSNSLEAFGGIIQQYLFYNEINPPKEV